MGNVQAFSPMRDSLCLGEYITFGQSHSLKACHRSLGIPFDVSRPRTMPTALDAFITSMAMDPGSISLYSHSVAARGTHADMGDPSPTCGTIS